VTVKHTLQSVLTLAIAVLVAFAGGSCRGGSTSRTPEAVANASNEVDPTGSSIYSAAHVPIPELGYNAREGRALYRHYCLDCHGDEGGGDGFNAYNLDPRPRSLADSTFQAQHSDADLETAIRSGGASVGLSRAMPPWGRTLNDRQIQNLVAYLRTLADVQ